MKRTTLILMTMLMLAALGGGIAQPGLAQTADDCPYQISGASGRRVCENTAIEFWDWTAPATGPVTFDTQGSGRSLKLTVRTFDPLTEVAAALNEVRFTAQQGVEYTIFAKSPTQQTGMIVLNWRASSSDGGNGSLAGADDFGSSGGSGTFIASVEVDIQGPNGLTAVGRDVTRIAPAPEVEGLTKGWHYKRNSSGDLHGLQINVGDTEVLVEQWLNGERQARAGYRNGKPFGEFANYADGELDGVQYDIGIGQDNWSFETWRDGTLHGPFGSYVDGEPEGNFGTFADSELDGMLHTIDEDGWSFEVYQDDTRHGPYGTYNADGQKDGPFGIYTNGRKNPGEVSWADGERAPGTDNRSPLPVPSSVPEEITFDPSALDSLSLGWPNLFFWEPDGDTLVYFISTEPAGMFDTFFNGSALSSHLSLSSSVSAGAAGRATVRACDPEGLCAEVTFKVLVQPHFTEKEPGNFSVEAPYCKTPLVFDANPVTEVEICARDLDYEDGDRLTLQLASQDGLTTYTTAQNGWYYLDLDFDPLRNSRSCKTVQVQGRIVDLGYKLEAHSKEVNWWDWDWITEPLCQAGWSPDCFVGPELWSHPGTEVNRVELIVKSGTDSETREWKMEAWGARSKGTIRIRAVGLEPEYPYCAEDTGADAQDEVEEAMRAAEEARRLAEQAGELDGTSTTDDDGTGDGEGETAARNPRQRGACEMYEEMYRCEGFNEWGVSPDEFTDTLCDYMIVWGDTLGEAQEKLAYKINENQRNRARMTEDDEHNRDYKYRTFHPNPREMTPPACCDDAYCYVYSG